MILLIEWLLAGIVIWALAGIGVMLLRRWAERRHVLDMPNERSSHVHPTPRGGGLAIVLVSLTGITIYNVFAPAQPWAALLPYLIGASLVALVSWWDDLREVRIGLRLLIHAVGAGLAVVAFGAWQTVAVPFLGPISLGWLGLPITLIWIVGVTNAFNFIDGIDGIAGGQTVVAGLGWFAIGGVSGNPIVSALGLLLATSSLGFLGQNWPPARIFMGDVGSAFLGYTLAILPLIGNRDDPRLPLTGALLYWPVLFDTGFTFLHRLLRGENVLAAHRSHLYQRLVIAGYPHLHVTVLYIAQAVVGALLAFAWITRLYWSGTTVALFVPSLCVILWVFVIRQERRRQRALNVAAGREPHTVGRFS